MANTSYLIENELGRLRTGPQTSEKPSGAGIVRFVVRCPFEVNEVLSRARSVLEAVDVATLAGWPENKKFVPIMPAWFIAVCCPPPSPEDAQDWLAWWKSLPLAEQAKAEMEKDWDLENWLYWMEPSQRQWFWWDARVLEHHDHIALAVEVQSWPFPWGALRWLFKAAGASAVEPEE